jgi:hypothetical protein
MERAAANGCMLLKFARLPMQSDWDAMAGVRALRRDIARRRWAEPSVDQMVIFTSTESNSAHRTTQG